MGAQRTALPDLALALWRGHAAGALDDDSAQRIAELIEARKAASIITPNSHDVVTSQRRNCGSRPRSSGSMERRRAWSAGSWMPPGIAAKFTLAEAAAMAVILREIVDRGACAMPVGAIAARAGVSETTVRNARRQAEQLGLVVVEIRRVAYDRNRPNLITVLSRELSLWLRSRSRMGQGWVQNAAADHQPFIPYLVSVSPANSDRGNRGEGGRAGDPSFGGRGFPLKSTLGRSGAPWRDFSGRRV